MKKLSANIRRPSLKRYRARMGHIVHVFLMRQVQKIVGQVIVLRGKQSFVKAELSQDEIDKIEEILAGVDFYGWAVLAGDIDGVIEEAVQDGGYEALRLLGLDVTADKEIYNVVNRRAIQYAETRSADLVTMVSDSTREMMRGDISEALTEGWSNSVLASKLSDNYAFSADRAMLIARTETIRASNQGTLAGFKASGVVPQKIWTTAEDDDVSEDCEANANQGAIGIDEAFDSGDDAPPAHPRCRCDIVGITQMELAEQPETEESEA
jgi:SPP1 gp7 family putative phage head morphogenesis protein